MLFRRLSLTFVFMVCIKANILGIIPPYMQTAILCDYAKNGEIENLKKSLHSDTQDINTQDENGCTPVWHAANAGQVEAVKYLLANNANINICDKNGVSPFGLGIAKNKPEMIALFKE